MGKTKYDVNKEDLIRDYKNGLTIDQLVEKYNYPRRYVLHNTKFLRKPRLKGTKEEIDKIISLYDSGLNQNQIASITKYKPETIGLWVRKYGKPRHRGPQSKVKNETFFDSIDTEEKAYFLGWIMADGCVSTYNHQYSLKLAVASIDKEIIENLLKAIEADYKIKDTIYISKKGTTTFRSYVSITSRHLVEALMKLGVVERKTSLESMPKTLQENLRPHFIRGFFDGDGITCTVGAKRSGFISSKGLLEDIQKYLNTSQTIFRQTKSDLPIYYFLGGIKFSRKLYKYLYENATIWLSRKRKRLEEICLGHDNTEITELIKMFQYCNA